MTPAIVLALLMQVDYPIVAVRAPRRGDTTVTSWQEVKDPIDGEPNTDLVLIQPDGTESVLVAGGPGACMDPCPSLDGAWVYYAKIHDFSDVNTQRRNGGKLTKQGSDIFKINVATREIVRLTNQEWTPNTGVGNWAADPNNRANTPGKDYLGYGVYNTGPCPLPNGRVMFTSSRNGFLAPKAFSFPNLQLYVMDADGKNVEQIGHLNISSALHPTLLANGEVAFSSWESQGYRDERDWAVWSIWPDGRQWGPLISNFLPLAAFHFQSQLTDGRIVVTAYYNQNNSGFGTILAFNQFPPSSSTAVVPRFGSPNPAANVPFTAINPHVGTQTTPVYELYRMPFSPNGLACLTPFATFEDRQSPLVAGVRQGKVTHPSGAPNNDLLLVYTPGPANEVVFPLPTPVYQGKIALLRGGAVATNPSNLVILKESPQWNYQQPKALVPWASIYGQAPVTLPDFKNDGTVHAKLPKGTPFGLIGTSSFYKRDSAPGAPTIFGLPLNWFYQGSDSGTYPNSEIDSVRIVQTEPASHLSYGPASTDPAKAWRNNIRERLRTIGEIKLRKFKPDGSPIMDIDGNPDTSFLARMPADVPFTFQTLDREGRVLNMAQTWHQLRPGEVRTDCGGCHAHSQIGTDFATTAAAQPGYEILDLTDSAKSYEFTRDIKPILDARGCTACHGPQNASGLNLQGPDAYDQLLRRTVPLRSRESKLASKVYGATLDGSGSAFAGQRMPLGGPPLPDAELRTITSWIDLGAANGPGNALDDLRPTLTLQSPPISSTGAVNEIRFGAFDSESGINRGSVSVVASFGVAGRAAGTELADLFTENGNWVWSLGTTLPEQGEVTVKVKDVQGNVQIVKRSFVTGSTPPEPPDCQALRDRIAVLEAKVAELLNRIAKAQEALKN